MFSSTFSQPFSANLMPKILIAGRMMKKDFLNASHDSDLHLKSHHNHQDVERERELIDYITR